MQQRRGPAVAGASGWEQFRPSPRTAGREKLLFGAGRQNDQISEMPEGLAFFRSCVRSFSSCGEQPAIDRDCCL